MQELAFLQGLVGGVFWLIGFCVLCGIFYRLGEARDLLRYLAEQVHEARLKAGKPPPGAGDSDSKT